MVGELFSPGELDAGGDLAGDLVGLEPGIPARPEQDAVNERLKGAELGEVGRGAEDGLVPALERAVASPSALLDRLGLADQGPGERVDPGGPVGPGCLPLADLGVQALDLDRGGQPVVDQPRRCG